MAKKSRLNLVVLLLEMLEFDPFDDAKLSLETLLPPGLLSYPLLLLLFVLLMITDDEVEIEELLGTVLLPFLGFCTLTSLDDDEEEFAILPPKTSSFIVFSVSSRPQPRRFLASVSFILAATCSTLWGKNSYRLCIAKPVIFTQCTCNAYYNTVL